MADFKKTFETILKLEFNSPKNALHFNDGEKGYTFMGVYQYAHPHWLGWDRIKELFAEDEKRYGQIAIKRVSEKAYSDIQLRYSAELFYELEFWKEMKLDKVTSQKMAEEIFVFGVNAGCQVAIKAAQVVLGFQGKYLDGDIGNMTINALNKFDEKVFDTEYDQLEKAHYNMLVKRNPTLEPNLKGWHNRAVAV